MSDGLGTGFGDDHSRRARRMRGDDRYGQSWDDRSAYGRGDDPYPDEGYGRSPYPGYGAPAGYPEPEPYERGYDPYEQTGRGGYDEAGYPPGGYRGGRGGGRYAGGGYDQPYGGDDGYDEGYRGGGRYGQGGYDQGGYPTGGFGAPGYDGYDDGPGTGPIPTGADGWPGWSDDEATGARRGGAGRGPANGGRKGRKKRGRTTLALLLTLCLLGGLAAGGFYGFSRIRAFFTAPDYNSAGTGQVLVEVKAGQTSSEIAQTLKAKDVVKSAQAFINAASKGKRGNTIQVGIYKLRQKMRAEDALLMMLAKDKNGNLINKASKKVTVPEGKTVKQTLDILAKATGIPLAQFQAAAKDPIALGIPEWWFNRLDKKPSVKSLEGFLFPDTYEFAPNATAVDVLKAMVGQFLDVAKQLDFVNVVQTQRKGISPYEALVVASLTQAEAGNADDLGKIARVAYNRVYLGTFACSCLQFDVTVNYWFELTGKPRKPSKEMTKSELDGAHNGYGRNEAGLPPTPIDNPGKAALQAAMNPPQGKWLYFVAIDKQGHSLFAETQAQHEANTAKACAAKIIC